jgi:drug/metabolite transporter (DMT)-like permease
VSPIAAAPIVFAIMGIVSLPIALRRRVRWDRATVLLVVANTAFDALNLVTFFEAMAVTTVAIAVLTHYLAPILVALAEPYVEHKPRNKTTLIAAGVALVGLAIVLEPWGTPAIGALPGAALGVASAVCYAGNVFAVRQLVVRIGAPSAMAYHALLAAVVMAPLVLGHTAELTVPALGLLAAGAVSIGATSGIVFGIGLARIGSSRAAVLAFAEPLVAVAVGVLAWGERLRPVAALGAALVVAAGIHVSRQAR